MNVLLTGKKFERGESAYYIYVWVSVLLCGSQFVCRERQVVRQVVDRCINKGGHNCGCLLDYGMHDIYPQLTKCCIMVKCM